MLIFSAHLPIHSTVPYRIHHSHKCQPKRCRESYGQIQDCYNSLDFKSLLTLGQRIELLNTMFHLMQILVRKVIRFLFRILRSLLGELASCAPIGIKIKLLLTKIRGQIRCFLTKFLCQWKSKIFFFLVKKKRDSRVVVIVPRPTIQLDKPMGTTNLNWSSETLNPHTP